MKLRFFISFVFFIYPLDFPLNFWSDEVGLNQIASDLVDCIFKQGVAKAAFALFSSGSSNTSFYFKFALRLQLSCLAVS